MDRRCVLQGEPATAPRVLELSASPLPPGLSTGLLSNPPGIPGLLQAPALDSLLSMHLVGARQGCAENVGLIGGNKRPDIISAGLAFTPMYPWRVGCHPLGGWEQFPVREMGRQASFYFPFKHKEEVLRREK